LSGSQHKAPGFAGGYLLHHFFPMTFPSNKARLTPNELADLLMADADIKKARVLIVDDDPIITAYLHDLLESSEMNLLIEIAHDGFEAGSKIHTFSPDVVLLDLMLPGIDGFRVCSQIKSDPTTKHVRVIAITGEDSIENVSRILAAGAETCLQKPLNPRELLQMIGQSLSLPKQ
jgi:DNA-binding response OmpR family regulator